MTYASLFEALQRIHPDTYDRAAPHGLTRFAVLRRYAATPLWADDRNLMDFPRCQLDVWTQSPDDDLPGLFAEFLSALDLPYELEDESWDDELNLYRTIFQMEVVGR